MVLKSIFFFPFKRNYLFALAFQVRRCVYIPAAVAVAGIGSYFSTQKTMEQSRWVDLTLCEVVLQEQRYMKIHPLVNVPSY